jgi:2-oxo-4-hydroxy-4-carboxy-5-ureidoimidazoline decarboxylase
MSMSDQSALDRLNLEEPAAAEHDLLACCASRRWADEILARRPYHDLAQLRSVSEQVLRALAWTDVGQALTAHPRIGERVGGASTEAAWSRDEQAGVGQNDDLVAGNVAYEERFGYVFLVCATGLSGEEMLTALRTRLGNDPDVERDVVREELRKIVDVRLGKAFG